MTVENERLKLRRYSVRTDEEGRRWIENSGGAPFVVPDRYQALFEMVSQGASLAQIARFVKPSANRGRFATIARFLSYLNDRDLLTDKRAVRLAEALKSDYVWNESLAFGPVVNFELFRFRGGGGQVAVSMRKATSNGLFIVGICSFIWTCLVVARSVRALPVAEVEIATLFPILLSFIFSFTVVRSARTFLQAFVMKAFASVGAPIFLRIDPVSISLGGEDLSKVYPTADYLKAIAGTAGLSLLSALLLRPVLPAAVALFVPIFLPLVLLSDFSPFRRSVLTEWFRGLYNLQDRKKDQSKSKSLENGVAENHRLAAIIWGVTLIAFVLAPLRVGALWIFKQGLITHHVVPFAILVFALFVIFLSFVDDLTSAWMNSSEKTIRQRFRRRAPSIRIDDAIKSGEAPSRADLAALPVLRQLTDETRLALLERATVVRIREGEAACHQGDTDRSLFVVLSGRFAVAKRIANKRRKVVAFLESGAVFGEVAFFIGQVKTADVVAVEESRVLKIPHDPRIAEIKAESSDEMKFRIWFLQSLVSNSLWKEIPSDALDALVFAGKLRNFRAGEKIIGEGEQADACYFLIQGRARVTQNTKTINHINAGEVFGEIALLNPESLRTATVVADSDLLTVMIESEKFWHLLGSHLPLGLEVERLAERRLQRDRTTST